MTAPEYKQLKAFARVDGALLAVLMITCFACYVAGLTSPLYGFLSIVAIVMMPFFAGIRLKRFRDNQEQMLGYALAVFYAFTFYYNIIKG